MPVSLVGALGQLCVDHHARGRQGEWDGGEQRDQRAVPALSCRRLRLPLRCCCPLAAACSGAVTKGSVVLHWPGMQGRQHCSIPVSRH